MNRIILILLMFMPLGASWPARPKGEDLFLSYPSDPDIVEVRLTPNITVNLTVSEISNVSRPNRDEYNAILRTLKVNENRYDKNILLKGLIPDPVPSSGANDDYSGFFPPTWAALIEGKFL